MTRKECERTIVEKLREIWDTYQEYYPGGDHLSVMVTSAAACVFNAHWNEDTLKPLDHYERVEEVGTDATYEW